MPESALASVARRTEERLEALFADVAERPISPLVASPPAPDILAEVRSLTLRGGKRLRAALLVHAASLFEPDAIDHAPVIDAAAALELLQTYLLIHDDLMDDDDTRRGGPSVHVALAAKTGDKRLGASLAILAGDLAVALHELVLARLDLPADRHRRVLEAFAVVHVDVVHGQVLDLTGTAAAAEIATHKTASYTTVGPIAAGAALGGASDAEILHLGQLALPLGIAFQMRDDLLCLFGDPAKTGKPFGSDLRLGKRTAVVERGIFCGDAVTRLAIEAALGHPEASDGQIAAALAALEDSGAKAACEAKLQELVLTFVAGLRAGNYHDAGRARLSELAHFLAEREQ